MTGSVQSAPSHRIAVLAPRRVNFLDMAIPTEIFRGTEAYTLDIVTVDDQPIESSTTGIRVEPTESITNLAAVDTIIVPGYTDFDQRPQEELSEALALAHERGARIASVCTGAFALAAAGLLSGRVATTHWSACSLLGAQYPDILVEPDKLYVDTGERVLTSAGVTSGIDLCLYLVRGDLGATVANDAARYLVAPPVRDGDQRQYIKPARSPNPASDLNEIRAWILENLTEQHSITALADRANMSARTFSRRFTEETGSSVFTWITAARLNSARTFLESSDLPIDRIGFATGLGSPANLRARFREAFGVSPREYRRRFRSS
ncbi:GlxA family transcriptional regulator [Nocardia sp. NPDC057272]|uniref:GlxA family transcriptional regulator n=1 Tax=Nocardia sp. NPDC057272 TaxID=3346079 RepID=UPI00362E2F6B